MINNHVHLISVTTTPTSENKSQRSQLSFKQYSDLIPRASRYRLFKQASKKRKVLLSNVCNKNGHVLIKEERSIL